MVLDPIITQLIRGLYFVIFALAVFHKSSDFGRFVKIVGEYNVLPSSILSAVSAGVLLLEFAVVIALIFAAPLGVLLAMSILISYAVLIAFNILRGHTDIDCGCNWGAKSLTDVPRLRWRTVLRNLVLVAFGVIGSFPAYDRSLGSVDYLNLSAVCIVGIFTYQAATTLMQNYNRMKDYGHV